jgi:hypothetical protein
LVLPAVGLTAEAKMSTKVFVAGPRDVSTTLTSLVGRISTFIAITCAEFYFRHDALVSFKRFKFCSDWTIVLSLFPY